MRELLSLRRDEAPIVGEVYRYKNEYLKCVASSGLSAVSCRKCFFDSEECFEECGAVCEAGTRLPPRHFERVPENELETAADVKFRHVEETQGERPKKDEIFIASVGLVKFTDTTGTLLNDCAACDLTMSECDGCRCLPNHCYQKIK